MDTPDDTDSSVLPHLVDPSDKKFAGIRFRHNPQAEMLLRALDHVRQFIIKNQLILVGGMSIDCAMRLRGKKLYEDDEIPDYDFWSPENDRHAKLLGSELCTMEFPNVDVITAIHTTTMKVRVDGNVVADITYMPCKQFDAARTLEYKGMRIVHPWYVMMDQFRSLSSPYERPPQEVIFERWRKDVKRLNLLLALYPLGDDTQKVDMPTVTPVSLRKEHLKKGALQGWVALAWHEHRAGVANPLGWTVSKDDVTAVVPVPYCSIMTEDVDAWIKLAATAGTPAVTPKFYSALFSYPAHFKSEASKDVAGIPALEVFDCWGERITLDERAAEDDLQVASILSVFYYFFNCWLLRGDPVALLGIRRAHAVVAAWPRDQRVGPLLSTVPYGTRSWNTSTLFSIAKLINYNRVKNWTPMNQSFDKSCDVRGSFDPLGSPLFQIGEDPVDALTPIVPHDRLQLA